MGFFGAFFNQLGRNTGKVFSNALFGDAWSTPYRMVGSGASGCGCGGCGGGCMSALLLPFKLLLGLLALPFILIYFLFTWPFYLIRRLLG